LDLATSKKFEPFSLVSATVPWTANCMQFLELSAMFFHGLLLLMHPNTKNPSLKGKPQKKKKKKKKEEKSPCSLLQNARVVRIFYKDSQFKMIILLSPPIVCCRI
jgi:hypothetical protein